MGDEADADWQAGLSEWGEEDAQKSDAQKFTGWRCPKCNEHYFNHALRYGRAICPRKKQR